jgi:hypothetical protein
MSAPFTPPWAFINAACLAMSRRNAFQAAVHEHEDSLTGPRLALTRKGRQGVCMLRHSFQQAWISREE